jgi:ABC-type Fe3+-hydroxamate transport system substrate-binding protein
VYGKTGVDFPQRIAKIPFAVGAGERVVGVPGTVGRPPADKILALEPDLVLAFSNLQRDGGERPPYAAISPHPGFT